MKDKKNNARFRCTNWDPHVNVNRHGASRADMARKVLTRGKITIPCDELLEAIKLHLRQGYEVSLGGAIRIFPCMDVSCTKMYPAAQTTGEFRSTLADKEVTVTHRGEVVDAEKIVTEARKRNETYKQQQVTPDTMVVCPKCGNRFRVGQKQQ